MKGINTTGVFRYNLMGHRIAKHSYDKNPAFNGGLGKLVKSTYYVLDAQGNTMSIYEREVNPSQQSVTYKQKEEHIYGSSRLGVRNSDVTMPLNAVVPAYSMTSVTHRIGDKGYELNNHLGNVLSVISDKPIPHVTTGTTVDYYMADIRQATDYSPFGAQLYGRTLLKSGAKLDRYGYQGSEMDNELKGSGNSYVTYFRMLDPRLGRWMSIDPVVQPWQSPYCTMDNNPVKYFDPLGNVVGLEGKRSTKRALVKRMNKENETQFKLSLDGSKLKKRIFSKVKGEFATQVNRAIEDPQEVTLKVKDQSSYFIDSYPTGVVDVGDLLKISDKVTFEFSLLHILNERFSNPNYDKTRTKTDYPTYEEDHCNAYEEQAKYLREQFPDLNLQIVGEIFHIPPFTDSDGKTTVDYKINFGDILFVFTFACKLDSDGSIVPNEKRQISNVLVISPEVDLLPRRKIEAPPTTLVKLRY